MGQTLDLIRVPQVPVSFQKALREKSLDHCL